MYRLLFPFISDTHPYYYIGVIDYIVETVFMYASTLQPVPSQNADWGTGEPKAPSVPVEEDCVVIASYRDYHWADVDCFSKNRFICERADEWVFFNEYW